MNKICIMATYTPLSLSLLLSKHIFSLNAQLSSKGWQESPQVLKTNENLEDRAESALTH